jgi:threonine synthase
VSRPASSLVCAGCGAAPAADDPYPFRCPNARSGDDTDHVMSRVLDVSAVRWPAGDEANPFVRYRDLLHSSHVAAVLGMSDAAYVELVEALDKEIAAVDGRGFGITPFGRAAGLSDALGFSPRGGVWVKDETGNVSGSHKARHLMGLMVYLQVVEGAAEDGERPDLAIASCGNAALAAAVVARAAGRTLHVFVPTWADPAVVARLEDLGSRLTVCERRPGVAGDPTYRELQRAVGAGAIPFTCQGNENGLCIEGGETIGYELASALGEEGVSLDRLFAQVGGGALASSIAQSLGEVHRLGVIDALPRLHAVQTGAGFPLKRAYDLVTERMGLRMDSDEASAHLADALRDGFDTPAVQDELRYAATHRSEFMWPWEKEPKSIAHGILDDETYDWLAVVTGMLGSGGWPLVVDEDTLIEANDVAKSATGIDVDHTGSSGLAGLLHVRRNGEIGPDERVAVLFTGVRR